MWFIIPSSIGSKFSYKALRDLGASINLVSLFIYKKLGFGEVSPTTLKLQLADKFYIFSRGEIENILVNVNKFIFPTNFVILYMKEDKDVQSSWGGHFLQ